MGVEKHCSELNFGRKNGIFDVTGPGPCQIKMTSFDFVLLREEQWLICNKAKKKKTVAAEQTPKHRGIHHR